MSGLLASIQAPAPGNTVVTAEPAGVEYRLKFLHLRTGERLDIVYRKGDRYVPKALDNLDHYLRDHRTGDIRQYDPRIFDLLHDLTTELGRSDAEIDVVCGYRTAWSNEFLRTHGPGVARYSVHMQAMAIRYSFGGSQDRRSQGCGFEAPPRWRWILRSIRFRPCRCRRMRRW